MRTKVAPEADAFTFATLAGIDGISKGDAKTLADAKAFLEELLLAKNKMDNDEVPEEGRILYATANLLNGLMMLDTYKSKEILSHFAIKKAVPQGRFYTAIDLLDGKSVDEEAGHYKKADAGKEINFMIIHKPAIIKHDKHVVSNVIPASANPDADADIVKYRKYGLVDDGEIRLKAVVDKSGVVDLEADLGEVEKKAGDAEKAVQDIKLDDSTEKSAKRAAGGVQDLARETRKATEETQRLNQAMQDTERHRNTKIHMNNGQVFDWGGNLVEDASRNTDEMEAAQERLSAAAQQTEQAMRSMAEETQKVNEASQGLGDNVADGIEQQLTPTQNMIAFIKKSFQDIPEMFGMLKEKVCWA